MIEAVEQVRTGDQRRTGWRKLELRLQQGIGERAFHWWSLGVDCCRRRGAAGRVEQRSSSGLVEIEGIGQLGHGGTIREAANAALEVADGAHTEVGTLGKRFLRQPGRQPVAPEQWAKRRSSGGLLPHTHRSPLLAWRRLTAW